ncbi:pre-toxin TG domain-containing protein [Parageobacillus thermoglucosidasius]|uniref:pre-toxin TG domain-containing protein n=1 Tax=Parageobacillus thermoglucosidasius TaxID=1426 RepID=UPI00025B76AF|nr:pre-toxin TG domain-containing protein [Parageobacillus thermoglucosidasius]EID45573.1 secreted protein by WXG100 family type VII secretion system [Parageobacillus thermoglucosidasius TNO-09.020]
MTTIRVKPEELETVAKHVPDAEDACRRARTSLSWELPSLVMEIPGIGSAAIQELTDELLHWLRRYEEKLNEVEELLYRTAAAMRQEDQTLADNMKEFGLELLGWYDLQRVFGEYDPVTGERLSFGDRLFAGGMLLLSVIPPAKGAGVAGKAAVKGAKAAGIAAEVLKWISKTKNVLNVDKIKGALQTIYHQVIKGPITETIRSFKHQWENFLENVGSVLQGSQPALAGIGPARGVWMSGAEREVKETTMNMIGKTGDEVVGKGTGKSTPTNTHTKVNYGEHYTRDGRRKVLKPNVEYTTPAGYTYRTDDKGRIVMLKVNLTWGRPNEIIMPRRWRVEKIDY